MDEILMALGFDSSAEFHRLVSDADLSTAEKQAAFKRWQDDDGSKEGLLRLQPAPQENLDHG